MVGRAGLWLRWSLRDLRRRWVLVGAIALLLALGTGLFTGLGSMRDWRVASNDRSYALLGVHDLRVALGEGVDVPAGGLARALAASPVGPDVAAAEERLLGPTQLAVEAPAGRIVVPARMVGVRMGGGGPAVDGVAVDGGRRPAGPSEVLVDAGFARARDLPPASPAAVGGEPVRVVGRAQSPEWFIVTEGPGGVPVPGGLAIVTAPLPTAQRLLGRPGRVNDLVLTLRDGADRDAAAAALRAHLDRASPDLGARVSTTDDIESRRLLYRDADGDQQLYSIFAALVLAGAALAAFNLISRVVEAERREIGVGMALGLGPAGLALRPALLGLQIGVLGSALGVAAGLAVARALRGVLADQLPLPVLVTPFQPGVFVRGALIGIGAVALATAWPVWRAVRVTPVEAIRSGARSARGGALGPWLARVRLPGGSLAQLPVRSVLRSPRRTALTAAGIAAVVAVVVALLGTLDAFRDTIDRSERETLGAAPGRAVVTLAGPLPIDSAAVRGVAAAPGVAAATPTLRIVAGARAAGSRELTLSLATAPPGGPWEPTPTSGAFGPAERGLLLSEVAAADLGVAPGEPVDLTYARPAPDGGLRLATARVAVAGTHPDPFRAFAYLRPAGAAALGLGGLAAEVQVVPEPGVTAARLAETLAGRTGVAAVAPASATTDALRDAIDDYTAVLLVPVGIAVVLALLIAFNTATINADERLREHATMFAVGLRPRVPVTLAMAESALVGLLGALGGVGLGWALLRYIVEVRVPDVLPEIGMRATLAPATLLAAGLVGVVAVALAPLLTVRRLRRMDVPAALRVVE